MKLFISYRRSDSIHAAQRVRMCLQMHFGVDAVFIDREIPAGKEWSAHLESVLTECTGVIVLVGDAFLRELRKGQDRKHEEIDTLAWEIETALRLKKTIYPVLIGALDMPDAGKLPAAIRGFAAYQAVFAREPAFDASMTVLIKSISDEHGWIAPPKDDAAAAPSSPFALSGMAWPLLALLGLAAVWFAGRVVLWLLGGPGTPKPVEAAFWYGMHYALATTLFGLGPYLAFKAVVELRARARLPSHTLHAVLSWCNLVLILIAGGTFLLLSTRAGWALELLWVFPENPTAIHYGAQGFVLVAIVLAALVLALLENRVRLLQGLLRAWSMGAINAMDVVVLLCGLWFAASLVQSSSQLAKLDVPLLGYLMLCPALSLLMVVWDYAQSQVGVRGRVWQLRVLFGLAVGLYLACTLGYFAYGPSRILIAGS